MQKDGSGDWVRGGKFFSLLRKVSKSTASPSGHSWFVMIDVMEYSHSFLIFTLFARIMRLIRVGKDDNGFGRFTVFLIGILFIFKSCGFCFSPFNEKLSSSDDVVVSVGGGADCSVDNDDNDCIAGVMLILNGVIFSGVLSSLIQLFFSFFGNAFCDFLPGLKVMGVLFSHENIVLKLAMLRRMGCSCVGN